MRESMCKVATLVCLAMLTGLGGLSPASAQPAGPVKVTGKVVDDNGKPVEGAAVAAFWVRSFRGDAKGTLRPSHGVTTNPEGEFSVELQLYGRDAALLAMSRDRRVGGIVMVQAKAPTMPVTIPIGPLTRVHGSISCSELGRAPEWTNIYFSVMPGQTRLVGNESEQAEFDVLLPPGTYQLKAYGTDVDNLRKEIVVKAGMPELDLTLNLPATIIARYKGKAPPAWHVTDARGVKKDVKLTEFKGRWILMEFWGFWCGPCTGNLQHLIDFYEDHNADRDKFEILAFHDAQAKTFDELDKKLVPIIKNVWGGRPLPFPILLDSTGETVEKFGIHGFPTALLIDPEGRLVGEADEEELEKKLPRVPLAVRVAEALDRNVTVYFKDPTLQEAADMLAKATRVPVTLDSRALNIAGLTPQTRVPLQIAGLISARSAFELAFDPFDLKVEATPAGLTLTQRPNGSVASRTLSKSQETWARRNEELLAQKTSFQLGSTSLEKLAQHLEGETRQNFVLDPRGRKTGAIDPKANVTAAAKDEALGKALNRILRPLGLHLEVRDEVVVIVAKP